MKKKNSLKEIILYRYDNLMAKGGISILGALVVFMGIAFVVMSIVRLVLLGLVTDDTITGISDVLWRAFTQVSQLSPILDKHAHVLHKSAGVLSVGLGIVFFSSLIAFLSNQFSSKVDQLRKGKSRVIEKDHFLIIGFNLQSIEIIEQLILADTSDKKNAIIVLSEEDKVGMDDILSTEITNLHHKRIITRSGDICSTALLRKMSITDARCTIILNTANVADPIEVRNRADSQVVETIIAVVAASAGDRVAPVVAQLHFQKSRSLAESIMPGIIKVIDTNDILAGILIQTSLNPGLALVYSSIVGFEEQSLYIKKPKKDWLNHPFGKLQFHFIDGILLGFSRKNGRILLNPPPDFVPDKTDHGIFLAPDAKSIKLYNKQVIQPKEQKYFMKKSRIVRERQLIIGWNSKIAALIGEYLKSVRDGSSIGIVVESIDEQKKSLMEEMREAYPAMKKAVLAGDVSDSSFMAELKPCTYDSVIILAEESLDSREVDLKTIYTVLTMRAWFQQRKKEKGEIFFHAGARDYLIPHKLTSKIIAHIAQKPELIQVFNSLFYKSEVSIYVKPVELYFKHVPLRVSFADCMHAAQLRNEVAIGLKIGSQALDIKNSFGLYIAPDKNRVFDITSSDSMVTLATDRN